MLNCVLDQPLENSYCIWRSELFCIFREHLLLLYIYLFRFFSLLFSYCKVLVCCYLCLNLLRNLFFFYEVDLAEEYILDFPQELMIAWGSCTMVLGNESSIVIIVRENIRLKVCCLAWFKNLSLHLTFCGIRFLGWWSIDEGSREEQARLYHEGASG